VKWWSLIVLDGYSRTMLAGAVAPSEASRVALMVLYTACLRYGAPEHLISDQGGASISDEFEAVCERLGIDHKRITSTEGESYLNLMETHFNVQRRLYDYQFALTSTPLEFEQAHQDFLQLYNTTAHQGLLEEQFASPIPRDVLGKAKGRLYTPDALERQFSRALFPRTTNRYGCVTLHSYHFYVEEGLPKTQVLLWIYGNELRVVFDNVVLDVHFVNPSPVFCLDKTGDCGHSQTRHIAVLPDTRQGLRLCQSRMRPPSPWRMRNGHSWKHSPAHIPLPKHWRSVVG